MIFGPMRLAAITALFLFAIACDKKTSTTPKAEPAKAPVKKETPKAPAGVPAEFKALFDKNWPAVKAAGDEFNEAFNDAKVAKKSNDRAAMDKAVATAQKQLTILQDKWAEVSYWPDNNLENDEKRA